MLLVCLSHFTAVYFRSEYEATGHLLPVQIAMIASPTFIALSGMMMGLMSVVYSRGFDRLRIKLADRALFLLTVGHALVIIARLWFEHDPRNALRMTVITDAVAVCVLAGVWLVPRTRSVTRVTLGLAVFAAAWLLIFFWQPTGSWATGIKEALVGGQPTRVLWYSVPIMQWLGVYLVCTALGEYIGGLYLLGDRKKVERTFMVVAAAAISLAIALRISSWPFRPSGSDEAHPWSWEPFFTPWSKLSPGPVYVLFFGGLGMALVSVVVMASHRRFGRIVLDRVTQIGRSSLAVFVLQNYVYYTLLGALALKQSKAWPEIFAVSLIPIFLFAAVWDKHQLNSVLTVGLAHFLRRQARRDPSQPSPASTG